MRIYLSHSSSFDYVSELYEPLERSLGRKHRIFFPHDKKNINTKSKNIIVDSDCVVAEVSFPSTGQGIELGWANAQNVPVVCIYRKGANFSKSLNFVSDNFIEYETTDEIVTKLETLFSR